MKLARVGPLPLEVDRQEVYDKMKKAKVEYELATEEELKQQDGTE